MADAIGTAPTPDEIRAALDRIVTSEVFERSPQLGAFLRFVVEAALQGRTDRIKAYTIGVEVLRRDTKFDPQLDPIVRVEATRLRRAMVRYYAGEGSSDPVIIDLPRGSYVPAFSSRAPIPGLLHSPSWLNRPLGLAAIGVVALVAVAAVLLHGSRHDAVVPAGPASQKIAALQAGNGMPMVQIEPIRVIGGPPAVAGVPAERLYAKISDAFTRFDTINVATSPETPGVEPRADYRLSGSVEYDGETANAWFTLASVSEGKVVWSRTFERVQPSGAAGLTEDDIVVSLTNSLLQSYGVIRARDRARQMASSEGDPRYRCVLEAADAIRTADRQTHEQARACLERLTEQDPGFAVGFSFLALIYNREFQLGYETRPGDAPPLDRALRAARQAITLRPESSRGYLALMVVQSNRRDNAAALAAGEKCLELNKYDMLALGEYGGRLVLSGDVKRGMTMLHEAGSNGAVRPAWHYIYMFVGSYVGGDMEQAIRAAHDIPVDNVALGQVALVLADHAAGDPIGAKKAIERLKVIGPGWDRDPRAELGRLIPDGAIVDRLTRDLASAGLPGV